MESPSDSTSTSASVPKVFLSLTPELSVLQLSVRRLVAARVLNGIAILVKPGEEADAARVLEQEAPELEHFVGLGGDTRQDSVYAGLRLIEGKAEFALIHDGARPFCSSEAVASVATIARQEGAAILAVPSKSSLKRVSASRIIESLPRAQIWEAQTPQVFRYSLIRDAHERARTDSYLGTDDAELVERIGAPVSIVPGVDTNIKITTPRDLVFARLLATSVL